MPGLLSAIGQAFEELPKPTTTLKDIGLVERRLGAHQLGFSSLGGASSTVVTTGGTFTLQPGTVYVHAKLAEEPVPSFDPLPKTGVGTIDANFRRRSEILMQEMLKGIRSSRLPASTGRRSAREDAGIAAERAAEDAALAKKRFEEDAAIAARRAQRDADRSTAACRRGPTASREGDAASLLSRWKGKFAELGAALEEAIASNEQQARGTAAEGGGGAHAGAGGARGGPRGGARGAADELRRTRAASPRWRRSAWRRSRRCAR